MCAIRAYCLMPVEPHRPLSDSEIRQGAGPRLTVWHPTHIREQRQLPDCITLPIVGCWHQKIGRINENHANRRALERTREAVR
jgi:hypothetical protein